MWNSEARFKVASAGRRSGKSELAKRHGSLHAAEHHLSHDFPGRYIFAAPTRDQAKHVYWEDLKALAIPWFTRRISESELFIELLDGTREVVVGLDKAQRIEGQPIHGFYGDEAQEWKQGIWDRTIRPALETAGQQGYAWVYGVPRPGAEFEHLEKLAKSGSPDWAYFRWKSADIVSASGLAEARASMDPRLYAQEFEADRVSLEGRMYPDFDREMHARESLFPKFYDVKAPLSFCLDFNRAPGVAAVCQEARFRHEPFERADRLEVADEIDAFLGEVHIPTNSNTPTVCRRLIADWGAHQGDVLLYGDPTGGNKGTAKVAGSDWDVALDILGRHFGHNRVELRVRKHAGPERPRVNALNARLKDASGIVRTLVDRDRCPNLCDDLEQVTAKPGTAGEIDKDRDKSKTHLSDAVTYRAEFEHGMGRAESVMQELR